MVMNKKERARMDELEREVELARSMRWPEYPAPRPIPKDQYIRGSGSPGRPFQGWVVKGGGGIGIQPNPCLKAVWADGLSHCLSDPDQEHEPVRQSGSKGPGEAYATVADAWRAYRLRCTRELAATLADIDRQIAAHDYPTDDTGEN